MPCHSPFRLPRSLDTYRPMCCNAAGGIRLPDSYTRNHSEREENSMFHTILVGPSGKGRSLWMEALLNALPYYLTLWG